MIRDPEHEKMPREDLEKLQLQRLQVKVREVHEKVPFYRQSFRDNGVAPDDVRSLADLARLLYGAPDKLSVKEYIKLSIIEPNRHIAKGFEEDTMPPDFAERMRVSELNLAVEYLAKQAGGG